MYEPIAATMAWRATAELATSALPDAPVRTEPWPPNRGIVRHLPGVLACLRAVRRAVSRPGQHVTAATISGARHRQAGRAGA